MRTAFIGGGVMAEAILSRALSGGVLKASDVRVAEPVDARREAVASSYGVSVTAANQSAAADADLVIVAVKPQHLDHVLADLAGKLGAMQTVLSIVAGIPIAKFTTSLSHEAVIRVMPNTPAQIGAGMSVWTATAAVPKETLETSAALLGALGQEWYVADEGYLDMATAVSGSGPAYVFAFIESLVEAGVYLGMPRDMATTLAVQTVAGSAELARGSDLSPATLREMVTSPGGTTAEALRALKAHGFQSTVLEAVTAAHRRAKELGGS
jgi:pyrroline-5-carboxylate reductase